MPVITFLDLPGEIRNAIYAYLLIIPYTPANALRFLPRAASDEDKIYPSILSTCKEIHEEAKQILYGCNTFIAHPNLLSSLPRLTLFHPTIKSAALVALIRRYHVRVRLDNDPNYSAADVTKAFNGVEEMTIDVFQAQFGSSNYEVLRLFEGVNGVKKITVMGSITEFPEYVEWLKTSIMSPDGVEVAGFGKVGEEVVDDVSDYDIWTHGGR